MSKITKQGVGTVINKMCQIDGDKLIVGQSDETIRLYQLSQLGGFQEDGPSLPSSTPIATYKFDDFTGINNLCSLNVKNLFISSGLNRSISVWDTRQTQPILFFKDIHYDTITSIDNYNEEIFASASDDGYVNIWDLRMGEFIKQLKVENNERIAAIKFVQTFNTGKHLLVAHSDKVSVLSAKDNFTKRITYKINNGTKDFTLMPELDGSQNSSNSPPGSVLESSDFRINQMEFSESDSSLYLGLQSKSSKSMSVNTLSVWNIDLQ